MRGQSELVSTLFIFMALTAVLVAGLAFTRAQFSTYESEVALTAGRNTVESIASVLRTSESTFYRIGVYLRKGFLYYDGIPYTLRIFITTPSGSAEVYNFTGKIPCLYYSLYEISVPSFSDTILNVVNGPISPLQDTPISVFNINYSWGVVVLPYLSLTGNKLAVHLTDMRSRGALGWGDAEIYINREVIEKPFIFNSTSSVTVEVTFSSSSYSYTKTISRSTNQIVVSIVVDIYKVETP